MNPLDDATESATESVRREAAPCPASSPSRPPPSGFWIERATVESDGREGQSTGSSSPIRCDGGHTTHITPPPLRFRWNGCERGWTGTGSVPNGLDYITIPYKINSDF